MYTFEDFFLKSSIALMTRNQISAWPMKKFILISRKILNFAVIWQVVFAKIFLNTRVYQYFVDQMTAVKIENRLVNFYMNTISEWAVGFRLMEISSSCGLKKTLKLAYGKENLASQGP